MTRDDLCLAIHDVRAKGMLPTLAAATGIRKIDLELFEVGHETVDTGARESLMLSALRLLGAWARNREKVGVL